MEDITNILADYLLISTFSFANKQALLFLVLVRSYLLKPETDKKCHDSHNGHAFTLHGAKQAQGIQKHALTYTYPVSLTFQIILISSQYSPNFRAPLGLRSAHAWKLSCQLHGELYLSSSPLSLPPFLLFFVQFNLQVS